MLISITTWWSGLDPTSQIYWGIAIVSSALFIIQLITTFVGLDTELEAEVDDLDTGFSLFSLRSILGFIVFFGWGGVAAIGQGVNPPKVIMIAFLSGFLAMVGIAYTFAQILKLQDSGTIDVMDSIGKYAEVYIPVPSLGSGLGKIQLELSGKTMEFEAKSEEVETLKTGSKVEIIDIHNGNIMIVKPI